MNIQFLCNLDIISKLATIFIAFCNLVFALIFFRKNFNLSKADKEKDRKIQLLKTLVLDHNLKHLYSFFDDILVNTEELTKLQTNIEQKQAINEKLAELFKSFRKNFLDFLLAIDDELYKKLLKESDNLQDHFTNSIFDEGINLTHSPKYNEVIVAKVTVIRTEIIKLLFNYRG